MAARTNEEARAVLESYVPLNARLRTITSPRPLLLAHYTSVQVIEQILKNNEIWLSNPLYMNDLEEMRLGVFLGAQLFPAFAQSATNDNRRMRLLIDHFSHYMAYLQNENAI